MSNRKPLFSFAENALYICISLLIAAAICAALVTRSISEQRYALSEDTRLVSLYLLKTAAQANSALSALAAYYASSDTLTPAQFTAFSDQVLRSQQTISSIQFVTYVKRSELGTFLRSIRHQMLPQFTVRGHTDGSNPVYISRQTDFLPITQVEPFTPQSIQILGVDLFSIANHHAALRRAIESGQPVLIPGNEIKPALSDDLWLLQPLYHGYQLPQTALNRQEQISGFLAVSINFDHLVQELPNTGNKYFELFIHAPDQIAPINLWKHLDQPVSGCCKTGTVDIHDQQSFSLYGYEWNLKVTRYLDWKDLNPALLAMVIAISLSLALVLYLFLRSQRSEFGAQQHAAQEQLRARKTLDAISDGVITTDRDGLVNYINPTAVTLLNCDSAIVNGEPVTDILKAKTPSEDFDSMFNSNSLDTRSVEQLTLLTPVGDEIPVELSVAPIPEPATQRPDGNVYIIRDRRLEHSLYERLTYQASHDPLTGLLNRNSFESTFDLRIKESSQLGTSHVLCYMDLDKFKQVNDTAGHMAGDIVLKQAAGILRNSVRVTDELARVGGDEFALLLVRCDMEQALNIAENIRSNIKSSGFSAGDINFKLGITIGLVEVRESTGNRQELMKAADTACYAAKQHGGNQIQIYRPDDQTITQWQKDSGWYEKIREALAGNSFEIWAQQIHPLAISPNAPYMTEFLIRLPEAGQVAKAAQFLPAAERYGLMPEIDRWMISNIIAMCAGISVIRDNPDDYLMFINMSGHTLGSTHTVEFILQQLEQHDLNASLLCFEITETALISNMNNARSLMKELKSAGCKFALDDFGTGLSSFAYLKHLPIDYLKIDREFIKDLQTEPIDRVMVDTINRTAHTLNLKTIAEGIDNQDTATTLRQLKIDFGQGDLCGKPVRFSADLLTPDALKEHAKQPD